MLPENVVRLKDMDEHTLKNLLLLYKARIINRTAGLIYATEDGLYLYEGGWTGKFGDETDAELPKVYKSMTTAMKWLEKARKDCCTNWEICFWVHPEVWYSPNTRYVKMDGSQFDGSPHR